MPILAQMRDMTIPRKDTSHAGDPLPEISARRAAFAALVRAHERSMLRAAVRMCAGDTDRAHDLVQDSLVRAYEAFLEGRFKPHLNARAWLLRIVTNLFINDYRRRLKWESGLDIDTLADAAQVDSPKSLAVDSPESALLSRSFSEPVERALAELSEEFRLCVILVDVEGLEYAEAAAALGIPIGTVRSRLARARIQLHNRLQEYAKSLGRA